MTSEELLREENDDLFHSDEIVETNDSDNIIELEENDLKMGLFLRMKTSQSSPSIFGQKKLSAHYLRSVYIFLFRIYAL